MTNYKIQYLSQGTWKDLRTKKPAYTKEEAEAVVRNLEHHRDATNRYFLKNMRHNQETPSVYVPYEYQMIEIETPPEKSILQMRKDGDI